MEELILYIPLESNITKKDLNINIEIDSIRISKKDNSLVYIEGEWCDKISIDDLNWTISNDKEGKVMEVYITKWRNTMTWWDKVVKGEKPIDT